MVVEEVEHDFAATLAVNFRHQFNIENYVGPHHPKSVFRDSF